MDAGITSTSGADPEALDLGGPPVAGEPGPSLEGRTLANGTWQVGRCIGRGGMGRVFEVSHSRLGRRFALKVIHEHHFRSRDAVRRFEREARAAARIRSPHVLDVVDLFPAPDGRPCIVSEYLEGEDLQTRLHRERRLAPAEAVALGRQLCEGLAAAHAHGVIHRDLKPSNLFLSVVRGAAGDAAELAGGLGAAESRPPKETLKILDFGVAKVLDDPSITRAGAVVGTPAYMPPEQARGQASGDLRADVYGVGAVLFRMLAGRAPYPGRRATEVLTAVISGPPPRLRTVAPGLPKELDALLARCLDPDPARRPADAIELGRALREVEGRLRGRPGAGVGGPADRPDGSEGGGPAGRGQRRGGGPVGGAAILGAGWVGQAGGLDASTAGDQGRFGPATSAGDDGPVATWDGGDQDAEGAESLGASPGRSPGMPGTLVLPSGAVAQARERTAAFLLGQAAVGPSLAAGGLVAGAAATAGVGLALAALGEPLPFALGPRRLALAFGAVAALVVAAELFRGGRNADPAARRVLGRRVRTALAAGLGCLGGLELASRVVGLALDGLPLLDAAGSAGRLAAAALVTLLAFGMASRHDRQ
jgi:serine/threonine-protein kinase